MIVGGFKITVRLFALALLTAALGGAAATADGATVQRGHVVDAHEPAKLIGSVRGTATVTNRGAGARGTFVVQLLRDGRVISSARYLLPAARKRVTAPVFSPRCLLRRAVYQTRARTGGGGWDYSAPRRVLC